MTNIKKILFISSNQHFVDMFLKDLIILLSKNFNLSLITRIKEKSNYFANLDIHDVFIKRKISPISDLLVTIIITIKVIIIKPDRVISTTPKTIIFGIFLKLIYPSLYRIHIYTGFTWSNMKGLKRKIFILLDRINIRYSNKVLFDSESQIDFLKKYNIESRNFYLINKGSIKGVDLKVFYKYENFLKHKLRKKYGIPKNQKIIMYLGRLDLDKGIKELIQSFINLASDYPDILLLLVGKDEMKINNYLKKISFKLKNKIIYLEHTNKPQDMFNISDIFCLPSKREGFGNSVIEASACEIPIVGSNIFGLSSSLIDGKNGLKFKVNDIHDLTSKLKMLIENETLSRTLGKNGREFVSKNFDKDEVLNSLKDLVLN